MPTPSDLDPAATSARRHHRRDAFGEGLRGWAACALLGAATAVPSLLARADVERPPPLEAHDRCSLWSGTSTGNDPSVMLELELCEGDGGITGRTQWSSTTSGYSVRSIAGTRRADGGYVLADVEMLQDRPENGWRFCLIDEYELIPAGPDHLDGTYVSNACSDSAVLALDRKPRPDEGRDAAGGAPPSGAPDGHAATRPDARNHDVPASARAPSEPPRTGCGCTTGTDGSPGVWLLALALSGLLRVATRARATRQTISPRGSTCSQSRSRSGPRWRL